MNDLRGNQLKAYKKNNIFTKLKNLIKRLFNKNSLNYNGNNLIDRHVSNFIDGIKIVEDEEKLRLLTLKKQFSNGQIGEEEISEEDIIKLETLYKERIKELRDELEKYKKEILAMRKAMKG